LCEVKKSKENGIDIMFAARRIFAHSCQPHKELFDDYFRRVVEKYESTHAGKGISASVRSCWIEVAIWLVSALYDAHQLGLRSVILPRSKSSFRGARHGYQAMY
jgi:hypothetical protein